MCEAFLLIKRIIKIYNLNKLNWHIIIEAMSIVVSTAAQIHGSPLNNSTAKAQYSFPKAKRDDLVAKRYLLSNNLAN